MLVWEYCRPGAEDEASPALWRVEEDILIFEKYIKYECGKGIGYVCESVRLWKEGEEAYMNREVVEL